MSVTNMIIPFGGHGVLLEEALLCWLALLCYG